jgi:S-adenosylmethionine/arginine decarboxylase-like enzyme
MDFYTCGDHTDPWAACEYAAEALDAKTMLTTEVKRGIEAGHNRFTHVVTTEHDTRELLATA